MKKSFQLKLKIGDQITLYGNSFFHMLGMSYATGRVTQVRLPGDGFVFQCQETGVEETIEDGDGDLELTLI